MSGREEGSKKKEGIESRGEEKEDKGKKEKK